MLRSASDSWHRSLCCRSVTFFGDDKQLAPFGSEKTQVCSVFDSQLLWQKKQGEGGCGVFGQHSWASIPPEGALFGHSLKALRASDPFGRQTSNLAQAPDFFSFQWLPLLNICCPTTGVSTSGAPAPSSIIPSVMLTHSYRLPPLLCGFVSAHMYNGLLQSVHIGGACADRCRARGFAEPTIVLTRL